MASTYATDGTVVDFTKRTTDPEFQLGAAVVGNENTGWVYVKASGAVPTGTCTVDANFALTDTAGNYTADKAFADGEYGWVRKTAVLV